MTDFNQKVRRTVLAAALIACAVFVATAIAFPFRLVPPWLIALASLLGLGVVSTMLALSVTQTGTTTSLDFIPQLGALLLIGPAGAVTLTLISQIISQFAVHRKKLEKGIYNTAQLVIAIAAAGVLYALLEGTWGIDQLSIVSNIIPFLGASTAYFAVNRAAISHIISISEGAEAKDVWSQLSSKLLFIDVAISPLALLVAYLYVRYGPSSLLFAVLPIIALRYTYGVNIELQHLNRDLLHVLVRTLEAQDPYTSGHSIRVSEGAKRIAKALGLSGNQIRSIEQAALLHDIGKVGSAYHKILQQEGPLTEQQVRLVHEHPERGVRIIDPVRSLPDQVKSNIRHHHEQYDGSGYPEGLEGEKIPLGARIIAVADTIDAMRSTRPYRKAQDLDDIREELMTRSGQQFDSEVVDAAIRAGLLDPETAVPLDLGTETHGLS